MNGYEKHYDEAGFWSKLKQFAGTIGRELLEKALTLYYALQDPDTPVRARLVITGALGYLIFPLDLIPDLTPLAGYSDDLGAIVMAIGIVAAHIKDEHVAQARGMVARLFGQGEAEAREEKEVGPRRD